MSVAALQELEVAAPRRRWARYSGYKPTEMTWVGNLPDHWRVFRLKNVASVRFSSVDKKTEEGETPVRLCNYTDVYNNDRIVDDPKFMRATASKDEIARHTLAKGDVLITKDSETWNDIAVPAYVTADMPGVLCGYHLAHVRPHSDRLDGAYLSRAFAADGIRQQFHVAANGITRYGLPNRAIAGAHFPVPPLDEQRAIAAFLDRETARIDELIAKKGRLYELLQEKRSAVIERAVAKVTAQTSKLRRVLAHRPKNGISPPTSDSTSGVPTFSIAAVRDGKIDIFGHLKFASLDKTNATPFRVSKGDILVVRGNANQSLVGTCGIVSEHPENCVYPDLLIRITPKEHIDPRFLVLVFNSGIVRSQMESLARTANGTLKISGSDVSSLQVPIPSPESQSVVLDEVDRETAKIDALANKVSLHVTLLKSYRSSLITAAVTGQIDVRQEAH